VADLFASAPLQLRASTSRPELRLERALDLVAVHGGTSAALPRAQRLDAVTLVVPAEMATDPALAGSRIGPVYRRVEGGGLVVPTGAVIVRLAEGDPVERHRSELRAAGYELVEALSYAPHAGWVRPVGDDIVEGLRGLGRLEAVPGVENVEPQLLSERRPRPT
jgi:hypothetical protein